MGARTVSLRVRPYRWRRVNPSRWRERGTLVQESFDVHYSAFGAVGGPGADQQPGMALPARVAIEQSIEQHRCGIDGDSLDDPPLDARAARDVGHHPRRRKKKRVVVKKKKASS